MSKLAILSGAGISAESGLKTFRDAGGLWEQYPVMEVASYEGWLKNPELVLEFYNQRRKQACQAVPNAGHRILAELEQWFQVTVITQNVDALHEKAGSSRVIHLHGELSKVRSSTHPSYIREIGDKEIHIGDCCPMGGQLRPHIVWFGESVPLFEEAIPYVEEADYFAIVGTSLNVYPAAGLLGYFPLNRPVFVIDPNEVPVPTSRKAVFIRKGAGEGAAVLKELLLKLEKLTP